MDVNEFSIACKLITNKLKGVELPKVLPPSMMPQMMPGMMPMMQQPGMVRMNAAGKNFNIFLQICTSFLLFPPPFSFLIFDFIAELFGVSMGNENMGGE